MQVSKEKDHMLFLFLGLFWEGGVHSTATAPLQGKQGEFLNEDATFWVKKVVLTSFGTNIWPGQGKA